MRDIEQLYRAHGKALLLYLRQTFGRGAAAEDLLQETFVRALRDPERMESAVSPRAWLFGIARHVGLSAVRQQRATVALDDEAAGELSQTARDLREAIGQLPGQLRQTLELRLRERLSYEEIAHVLEIPVGTVRSRLHTAMRLLREAMKED